MSTNDTRTNSKQEEEARVRALLAKHEARLIEIANLVAHVRHEINNPLTGVLGQAQLLQRESLSASMRRRVEIIEQLAVRIKDTVAMLNDVQATLPQTEGSEAITQAADALQEKHKQ